VQQADLLPLVWESAARLEPSANRR